MAASSSTDLKLVNVVNALQKLTLNQTKNLALQLGVELNVLIDIESEEKGETRRAHYIQAWLDIDTEASWEKIIVALNQIGMKVVAAHVTSQYLPKPQELIRSSDPTSLPDPVASYPGLTQDTTSDPTPPQVQVPESGLAQLSLHTTQPPLDKATLHEVDPEVDPESPPDDAPQPIALEVDPEKVGQAKATIEHLEDSFSDVWSDTCEDLCEKESQDPKFFNRFRNKLLLLPVAKKRIHVKFFHDSEDEIIDAKNVRKLFAILSRYCNWSNYEVLLHLVNKFCEATKSSMMKYCSEIESFELTTTVNVYLIATSASAELSLVFSKMVVKMNRKASSCSLHDIRKFNEALSEKASLAPHSVYIQAIGPGSVVVELRFPPSAVGWVLAAMTPDFLHTHNLIEVTVDGQPLTTIEGDQYRLDEELRVAARSGDVVRVASLLNSGADKDTTNNFTPLMEAASVGHITTQRLLLDRGAEVDRKSQSGRTALALASEYCETEAVVELVRAGADVNLQTNDGNSPLMLAAREGKTDNVVELIKEGADIDMQNIYGNSALMIAAREGKTDTVVELMKEGADSDMQNIYGNSSLMLAARCGNTDTLVELIKGGADIHMRNIDGESALMIGAMFGNTDTIVELIKEGADIHMQDKDGNTALTLGSGERGTVTVVVVLLKAGAIVNLQNNDGESALMTAARYGKTDVVVELVKGGADIHMQDKGGDSALILASGQCGTEAVVELVKAGADVNQQNNDGESALMMAARMGKTKAVVEMAKAGADLNLQDSRGNSALMIACSVGGIYENLRMGAQSLVRDSSEPAAVELIKAGTNLDIQNEDGDTAVILATVHSKPDALQELVRAGADLNVQNNEGLTALMISVRTWGWSWSGHELTDILLTGKNIDLDIQENSTGWSALFFAAENGNANALQSLLQAGANAHLKDKSGLTVLEFATAFCEETKDPDHRQHSKYKDLLRVCEVLRSYIQESTGAIKYSWNSMKQRANNLLQRIDGRLRSAKKKAEKEEKLLIMDDNQRREKEQAELRELEQAAVIERKRRGRARGNRSSDNTTVTFNIT